MDIKLKHRLVGACVILALAVFFLPMILDNEKYNSDIESQIPEDSVLQGQKQGVDQEGQQNTSDSGSLTINLDEDEPEKAIIKPSEQVSQPNPEEKSENNTEGDVEKSAEPSKESESSQSESTGSLPAEGSSHANGSSQANGSSHQNPTNDVSSEEPEPAKAESEQDTEIPKTETPKEVADKGAAQEETNLPVNNKPEFEEAAWVIQIGSFSNKENATSLVSELRTQGYRAYLREAGEYSRVFVGPYPDESAANSRTEGLEKVVGANVKVIKFDPQAH